MVYPKHVDARGTFQELYRSSHSISPQQISLCTINPGETRGGHYHKEMYEMFIVIEGEMTLTQKDVKSERVKIVKMATDHDQGIWNFPLEWHEVCSKEGCTFLILLDREFDPENPDTYTL